MAKLTSLHLENFAKTSQRLGLASDAHLSQQEELNNVKAKKTNLVFSADPLESDVTPIKVPIGSIAELNKKVGVADDGDDSHIEYPGELASAHHQLFGSATSKADLESRMDADLASNVKAAAKAYIMGNSAKVKSYEPMINTLMFPGTLTVFSGTDLNIPDGETYTIKGPGPVALNYQQVTVGVGATLMIQTDVNMTAQIFEQE